MSPAFFVPPDCQTNGEFGSDIKKKILSIREWSCILQGNMATSGSVTPFPPASPPCVSFLSRRGRNKNILAEIEASYFFSFSNRVHHSVSHTKYKIAWDGK